MSMQLRRLAPSVIYFVVFTLINPCYFVTQSFIVNDLFQLFRHFGIIFKIAIIGVLSLLLLIPLHMLDSLLQERLARRTSAVQEITATWGPSQSVIGPILVVPYQITWKEKKNDPAKKDASIEKTKTATLNLYFLPDELTVQGTIEPEIRRRGIFEAVLYRANLQLEGTFTRIDADQFKFEQGGTALWDQACLALSVSDLKGLDRAVTIKANDQESTFVPDMGVKGFTSGIHAPIRSAGPDKPLRFSLDLSLDGSGMLNFIPVGQRQTVSLKSSWPSPGFGGSILPQKSQVTAGGFNATWEGSYYSRKYPQAWTQLSGGMVLNESSAGESQFGVRFLNLVDHYRSVERAIKYGILFIALIFMVFFLFELITKIRVHMFQYILVGAALCLFYLALLSLSELLQFGLSYLAAATACTLMVSLYSLNILRSGARTAILGLGLFLTYGFLYIILQMEDYSLIAGTVGLFISLGAVMYATRNVNWYGDESSAPVPPPIPPAVKA